MSLNRNQTTYHMHNLSGERQTSQGTCLLRAKMWRPPHSLWMGEELCYTLFIIQQRSSVSDTHDPYQALRFSGFRLLLIGIFIAGLGEKMIDVAIGWELYERAGSALVLGGVGLALVIPVILLSLPAGHIIDRFNLKSIVITSQIVLALVSLGLTALSFTH